LANHKILKLNGTHQITVSPDEFNMLDWKQIHYRENTEALVFANKQTDL